MLTCISKSPQRHTYNSTWGRNYSKRLPLPHWRMFSCSSFLTFNSMYRILLEMGAWLQGHLIIKSDSGVNAFLSHVSVNWAKNVSVVLISIYFILLFFLFNPDFYSLPFSCLGNQKKCWIGMRLWQVTSPISICSLFFLSAN